MLAIIETSSRFTVFHISGFGCDKFLMGVTSNVIAIKSQAKLNREGSESIWFLSGSNPIRKSGGNDWKSVCSCMFSTTRPTTVVELSSRLVHTLERVRAEEVSLRLQQVRGQTL